MDNSSNPGAKMSSHQWPLVQTESDAAKFANAWLVHPGDKLILAYDRYLDDAEVRVLTERCHAVLPGVEVVIIDGVRQVLVHRPGDPLRAVGGKVTP